MQTATPTRSVPDAPPSARPRRRRVAARHWVPYLFISPFFIVFAVFGLFPLLFSVWLSFQHWEPSAGLAAMEWVGWKNYIYAITEDDWFHKSLYNTLWLALVAGVPQHLVALPLAYFFQTALGRWRNGVVALYFLPFITSTVAIALIFTSLFSRDFGVINVVLTWLGHVPGLGWLFPQEVVDWTQPQYVKWQIAAVVWWRYVGWNTVLYLSAMQAIPRDLYEAATMDGAKPWQQFRHITLPMVRPMMYFAVTLTIIGNLQLFEEPFILTGGTGGLDQAGKTAAMHMYATAFITDNEFGLPAATAWLLFMLIGLLTWANQKIMGHKP